MVSTDGEWQATEDVFEVFHCINHRQQFSASDTVVLFRFIEGATMKGNDTFSLWGQLREHSTKTGVASVCVEDERKLWVGGNQHRVFT